MTPPLHVHRQRALSRKARGRAGRASLSPSRWRGAPGNSARRSPTTLTRRKGSRSPSSPSSTRHRSSSPTPTASSREEGLDVEFIQGREFHRSDSVAPQRRPRRHPRRPRIPVCSTRWQGGIAVRMVADRGYLDPSGCTSIAIAVPPGRAAAMQANPRRVKRISIERQFGMLYMIEKSLEECRPHARQPRHQDHPAAAGGRGVRPRGRWTPPSSPSPGSPVT